MKTNLEKWNHYKAILDNRANEFMDSLDVNIPEVFYQVTPIGSLTICNTIRRYYSFKGLPYFDKRPTKQNIIDLIKLNDEIHFTSDQIYIEYSYVYLMRDDREYKATTSISLKNLLDTKNTFLKKEDAEEVASDLKKKFDELNLFRQTHKKDASYDYKSNGYTFLGWQNGWRSIYFDEDGKVTTGDISKGEKPKKSFGYDKEEYPLYGKCMDAGHHRIEVQHNNRGSENTVSCPICKVYWKYDCSD